MNGSFYSSSIKDLVDRSSETVLGYLAKQNPFALDALQRNAWLSQIDLVRTQLRMAIDPPKEVFALAHRVGVLDLSGRARAQR